MKHGWHAMRRARAALALTLIMASMLLFLLPVFGESTVDEPRSEMISETQPSQPAAMIPEDAGALSLALENGQLGLAAE